MTCAVILISFIDLLGLFVYNSPLFLFKSRPEE